MHIINEQIASFRTSMLGEFSDNQPWELTCDSIGIVGLILSKLTGGYIVNNNVAVHNSAVIEGGVIIKGPAIIGPGCFIATGVYIRGGCWLEANCILGPGAELKSSFVFRDSKLAHFNFVGDSILGCEVNLEAGAIIANYRNEQADPRISFMYRGERIDTCVEKFGALVGDRTKIGANAVISPGAILTSDTIVKRLSLVDHGVDKHTT